VSQAAAITTRTGRRRKLTPELIAKVRDLVPSGAPDKTIAAACGITHQAWCLWLKRARDGVGDELERELFEAVQQGRAQGELTHIQKIFAGDSKDSQWLLTHSPHWRHNWSDNAAAQRAVQRQMDGVVAAIESTQSLSTEQKHDLVLQLQARGLGGVLPQVEADAGT
jgi:hypothetical protein